MTLSLKDLLCVYNPTLVLLSVFLQARKMSKRFIAFSYLSSEFLDSCEGLDVLLCDVVSGHGCKVCLGLLLHVQLPVVAC